MASMVMKRALAGGLRKSDLYEENEEGQPCDEQSLEICERGMRLQTNCELKLQTSYDVALSYRDDRGEVRKFTVEATVVDTKLLRDGCHHVTMYFCEVPPELRRAIKDGSLIEACFNGGAECREGRGCSDSE